MLHSGNNYTGNKRFYGFCVDILESISREVGFDYLIDLVPDGKYGAKHYPTGKWNGMVYELMQHVRFIFCYVLLLLFYSLNKTQLVC